MRVRFTKGDGRSDFVEATRTDGTTVATSLPAKGPFPHDAVHLIVERGLGLRRAVWGHIAAGATFAEVAAITKAGGHASAQRPDEPAEAIVELVQAERLVECFEAELWSGDRTNPGSTFRSLLEPACAQSRVPVPDVSDESIENVRIELVTTGLTWSALARGHALELEWSVSDA